VYDSEKEPIWKKHKKDHIDPPVTQFNEKPFGAPVNEIADTFLKNSAVSVGLFNGNYFFCSTILHACEFFISDLPRND
jgi:hypothetical protein